MLKRVWTIIKRLILGAIIIYGFNLITYPLNLTIPINLITVLAVSILGIPALLSFIVIMLVLF